MCAVLPRPHSTCNYCSALRGSSQVSPPQVCRLLRACNLQHMLYSPDALADTKPTLLMQLRFINKSKNSCRCRILSVTKIAFQHHSHTQSAKQQFFLIYGSDNIPQNTKSCLRTHFIIKWIIGIKISSRQLIKPRPFTAAAAA